MKNLTLSLALVLGLVAQKAMAYTDRTAITVNGTIVSVALTQTVNVTCQAETSYEALSATFDAAAVATALGISDISSAAQYIVNVTTGEAVENTTDGWRDYNGDMASWGNAGGVCVKIQTPSEGTIDWIGCYDTAREAGDEYIALWGFVANDKAAIVKVVITFEGGSAKAPEAETDINNVTIKGTYSFAVERTTDQGYTEQSLSLDASGLAAALGVEASDLASYFAKDVYALTNNDDAYGEKTSTLALLTSTSGWLKRTCELDANGSAGDYTSELCLSEWSSSVHVYVQELSYDAETEEITGILGNYPGNIEEGDVLYVNLYVMNGSDAVQITLTVTFVAPTYASVSDLTIKGEATQVVNVYSDTNNYTATIDVDAIAEALGCSASNLSVKALVSESSFSNNTTANMGGYWFDTNGYVASWGSGCSYYVQPAVTTADFSTVDLGAYETFDVGTVTNIKLYFIYGSNAYILTLAITVVEKEATDFTKLTQKGTRSVTIQQLLDTEYSWSDDGTIALTTIDDLLGTTAYTVYGLDSDGNLDNGYTMSPTPGFWLTAEGTTTSWGSSSYWGYTTAYSTDDDLVFNCMQFPGLTAEGDVYTAKVYLVSASNDYVLVNLTYKVVSEIVESVQVGEIDMVKCVDNEETDEAVDIDAIAEALGCEADELEVGSVMRGTGSYTTLVQMSTGLGFTSTGECVEASEGVWGMYIENGWMYTYVTGTIAEDLDVTSQFAIEINGAYYVVNVRFVSPTIYAGVGAPSAATKSTATYDLSGRQVTNPQQKGIYIQGGKKIAK